MSINQVNKTQLRSFLRAALKEDLGRGDVTSRSLFPRNYTVKAEIIAKEPCVVSGIPIVKELCAIVDKKLRVVAKTRDGAELKKGDIVLTMQGPIKSILSAERLCLNFLGKLSGITSLTYEFAARVKRTKAAIMDTRKTTPTLRELERYAVRCGGGKNHRFGLFDQVLIKDNHLWAKEEYEKKKLPLDQVVALSRKRAPKGVKIEIEVDTHEQLRAVLPARPDIILLDNMNVIQLFAAVKIVKKFCAANRVKKPLLEASGGISLGNVGAIARSGVDRISIGALTHSAVQKDFSLELV